MHKREPLDNRSLFYERFADDFDAKMNMYDLERRLEIVYDELLGTTLSGKTLLDAGCGTGWFSQRAVAAGATVTSLDVGERLLERVAQKCESERIVGSVLDLPFDAGHFDVVVCSEVIEHTVDPRAAVHELARVVKPGGTLVITVPNRVWHFAIDIANWLKLRPYEGYENWVSWRELPKWVAETGLEVQQLRGFHLFPFLIPATYRLLRAVDRFGRTLGPAMLNLAVCARKPGSSLHGG